MPIIFKDDKKEKHMSHEAIFNASAAGAYYYTDVEITGYGASKDEALKNLKIAMDDVAYQIALGPNDKLRGSEAVPLE